MMGDNVLVKDIMKKNVVTIDVNDTVFSACIKYRDEKVGSLIVIDEKRCVGIVTERDIIERVICLLRDPETTKVSEIMSTDVKTIHRLDKIEKATEILKENNIKKLPVVSDDVLVGIVTVTDISKANPELTKEFMDKWIKARWEIT